MRAKQCFKKEINQKEGLEVGFQFKKRKQSQKKEGDD